MQKLFSVNKHYQVRSQTSCPLCRVNKNALRWLAFTQHLPLCVHFICFTLHGSLRPGSQLSLSPVGPLAKPFCLLSTRVAYSGQVIAERIQCYWFFALSFHWIFWTESKRSLGFFVCVILFAHVWVLSVFACLFLWCRFKRHSWWLQYPFRVHCRAHPSGVRKALVIPLHLFVVSYWHRSCSFCSWPSD